MNQIEEIEDSIRILIIYMESKIKEKDWHGVADAAMDIREKEAALKVLRDLD